MTHLCKEDIRANPTPRMVTQRAVLLLLALLAASLGGCSSSDNPPVLRDDASLSSLSISGVTLDPEFSPSVTDYSAAVSFPSKSTLVTATTADINSTVDVNGSLVASGIVSDPIALDEGGNTITVNVTAEDQTNKQTYTVAVNRQSASEFTQKTYLKVITRDAENWWGFQLALSADGRTLAAGDPLERGGATGINGDETDLSADSAGAVYVLTRDSADQWIQQAYVKASNTEQDDFFGFSTALSADGSTLAVGAINESSAATGVNGDQGNNDARGSGAVYVYVRDNVGVWTQQAYIKASNVDSFDDFGRHIALSDDGATLAVAAAPEASAATGVNGDQTDNSAPGSGAVYVFARHSGGVWIQQAYIKASGTGSGFAFGWSVALSEDGDTLAVGGSHDGTAAAYVLTRDGGDTWTQQAVVKASQSDPHDCFGCSVELSDDGSTLAMAAENEDGAATGINGDDAGNSATNSGAAYVFARDSEGSWIQQAYIKASNTEAWDFFGRSISLSADGSMLVVGSTDESSAATGVNGDDTDNSATSSGAVYVFTRDSGEAWSQRAYIKPSTGEPYQRFGSKVAVSGDGTILAVDAEGDLGAVYFFEL